MKRSSTALATLIAICMSLLAAAQSQSPASAAAGQVARITQGPVIQYADDQFAVISWTTDVPTDSRVYYGTNANNLDRVAENRTSGTTHRVDLSKLQPSTVYFFRVDTGDTATAATDSFQTVAGGASPVRSQPATHLTQPQTAVITKGPLLQYTDESSAVITWSTATPTPSKVYYSANTHNLDQIGEESGSNTYHRVHLSNLRPGTTYYFQVDTGQGTRGAEHVFQTLASGAQPVFDQQPKQVTASTGPQLGTRPATPAPPPTGRQLIVPAGTEIDATLQEDLSSKTNKTGDTFTAVIAQDVKASNGQVAIPAGTVVNGEVTEAEQGKTLPTVRGRGRLNFHFRDMTFPSHRSFPITATLVSVKGKATGSEGEVTSGTSGKTAAKDVGIGAGLGTVAGLIFGSALKGLAIGAIAGGGYVLATQGKDVELPAQSNLKLRLDQSVTVPASAVTAAPAAPPSP
jgi:hypothetical protein